MAGVLLSVVASRAMNSVISRTVKSRLKAVLKRVFLVSLKIAIMETI